jgi:DNA-binding transcriptional LysR family regulator
VFSQLESLIVFSQSKSMSEAAVKLRISQSALSKRISKLEHLIGFAVIEYQGRHAKLTPRAIDLLNRVEPLVAEITDAVHCAESPTAPVLSIALADAIMVSWGAGLMVALKDRFANIKYEMHSHRTAVVIERLSRGRYQMGLCTGLVAERNGLIVSPLMDEPMAIVIAEPLRASFNAWQFEGRPLDVCCIEKSSAMWRFLEPHFETWKLNPAITLESSVGAARLAVEGYCHALVPIGVAASVVHRDQYIEIKGGLAGVDSNQVLSRPCSIVSRKSVLNHAVFKEVYSFIHQYVKGLSIK